MRAKIKHPKQTNVIEDRRMKVSMSEGVLIRLDIRRGLILIALTKALL